MGWDAEQIHNAETIYQVGKSLGASTRDIQIALMTSLVESGLHNVNYGDRDSLGLFQQRAAWGSREQRMNPEESARMFFLGGHEGQRGLFDIKNRDALSMGQAAQAVQVSAYPDRYAEQAGAASKLLEHVSNTVGAPGTLGAVPGIDTVNPLTLDAAMSKTLGSQPGSDILANPVAEATNPEALGEAQSPALGTAFSAALQSQVPAADTSQAMRLPTLADFGINPDEATGGWRKRVVDIARQYLGTPYVWGGEAPGGFDCSGLVQYVYQQLGIDLPRLSWDQANSGHHIALDKLKPGDLVAWNNSPSHSGADHIAVYAGQGQIIEAPRPGGSVQVSNLYDTDQAWGVRIRH